MKKMNKWLGVVLTMFVLLAGTIPVQANTDELSKAKTYYLEKREKTLAWADDILAVEAIGLEVENVSNGFDVSEFLETDFEALNAGALGKAIIAICLMEMNPRDINGVDLVAMLEGYYQADGSFASTNPSEYASIYSVPFDVLALKIVNSNLDMSKTVTYFTSQQDVSGAFGYESNGFHPDYAATSWVMMALHYLGEQANVTNIVQYLNNEIDDSVHGWNQYGGIDANTQATVLWSLYEVGQKNYAQEYEALVTLQTSDGGFRYDLSRVDKADNISTQQAMLAVGTNHQGSLLKKAQAEYTIAITNQEQTVTNNDDSIKVSGRFPLGTTLQTQVVSDTADIKNALQNNLEVIVNRIYAIDISLIGTNNGIVQPNGNVTVQIKKPNGFTMGFAIYRQEIDGTFTKLTYQIDGEYVLFETSHFSKYIFVEGKTNKDSKEIEDEIVKTTDNTTISMMYSTLVVSALAIYILKRKKMSMNT